MSFSEQSNGAGAQINSYRVPKIPPFWRHDPKTWFAQVEATFRVANCKTDRTKADYLISALESEVVEHVSDLITLDPPPENFYHVIKERVLSVFSVSPEARLRQLLKGQSLGDRKPSHLLNHMRQLNGGQCSASVLKSLFLEQLPESQRAILVAMNEPDLQKLAEVADKIADISGHDLAIAPIQAKETKSKSRNGNNPNVPPDIASQLSELLKRVTAIEKKMSKRERERSAPRSRANSKQRDEQKSDAKPGLCFAHKKYGLNAKICRKPCTWKDADASEN